MHRSRSCTRQAPATCFGRVVSVARVDSGTRSVHKTDESSSSCVRFRIRYSSETAKNASRHAVVRRGPARVDVEMVLLERAPVRPVVRRGSQTHQELGCTRSAGPVVAIRRCDCVGVEARLKLKSRSRSASWVSSGGTPTKGTWNERG